MRLRPVPGISHSFCVISWISRSWSPRLAFVRFRSGPISPNRNSATFSRSSRSSMASPPPRKLSPRRPHRRRKAWVGRVRGGIDAAVHETVGGHDDPRLVQLPDPGQAPRDLTLLAVSAYPVLLALTRDHRQPPALLQSLQHGQHDDPPWRQESPPVAPGPHRMHRSTVRTSPALHPQLARLPIEVPRHVPVSPQLRPSAARTPRRALPWIRLTGTTE
jgi:hypothetical protein